jgi:SWIM zinc finger
MGMMSDGREAKARELAQQGHVFPVPGLSQTAVVLSSYRSMPYVVSFASGHVSCTCLDWELRQEKAGGDCKHIKAARLDAGLDDQAEQVTRIKGKRTLLMQIQEEEELGADRDWPKGAA